MKIEFENNGVRYRSNLADGVSLAKPVELNAIQANPWNAPHPCSIPIEIGDFVGDTSAGGSCNVEQLSIIPHCHGAHTETVGHIVDDEICISDLSTALLQPATVISVEPLPASETNESYQPELTDADHVVTATMLEKCLDGNDNFRRDALIVRTSTRNDYAVLPFFSNEAMKLIVEQGTSHLLVDFPSVDRLNDDGLLSNHRIFWNVDPGKKNVSPESRITSTITELISVPDQVKDGPYLLTIQFPLLKTDAILSNPIVYPIARV